MALLFLLLTTLVSFFGCTSSQSPNINEYPSDVQSNKCHLNTIEVALPKNWTGSGNTTKYYENQELPGTCILIGENCEEEEDIAKNLELFRGTDFYRNRIEFEYYENSSNNEEYVSGILKNNRLNTKLYFCGFYINSPKAYIFCLCENKQDMTFAKELVNEMYATKRILEE